MNSHASQSSFLLDQSISEIKDVTIPSARIFSTPIPNLFLQLFFLTKQINLVILKEKKISEPNFNKGI
jgi:hypothetical protein